MVALLSAFYCASNVHVITHVTLLVSYGTLEQSAYCMCLQLPVYGVSSWASLVRDYFEYLLMFEVSAYRCVRGHSGAACLCDNYNPKAD
jgi:hypothetical protein